MSDEKKMEQILETTPAAEQATENESQETRESASVEVEPDVATEAPRDLASLVDIPSPEPTAGRPEEAEPVLQSDESANENVVVNSLDESSFDILSAELGDIEELKHDAFFKDISEDHIKELPTVARRLLHNFRIAYELRKKEFDSQIKAKESSVSGRMKRLQDLERDFARRQAQFTSIIDDPKVRKVLSQPESELPDPLTEAGINARIERGIAKGLNTILTPMQEVAQQRQQESTYLDFLAKHPEMNEASFKKEVAGLVRERHSAGSPVSTQDAYHLVKARNLINENNARMSQERRSRAEASRRVSRTSASGSPGVEGIPDSVKKRGAASIVSWLQANPEAAKRIATEIRS